MASCAELGRGEPSSGESAWSPWTKNRPRGAGWQASHAPARRTIPNRASSARRGAGTPIAGRNRPRRSAARTGCSKEFSAMADLMLMPFSAALPAFRDGSDTPRQFLERAIERCAADEPSERWKAGRPLSPIDGMPVGIKDVIETLDMPTGMGSPAWDGWHSGRDAASVLALREAGAVIFGKTKTTEYASAYPTDTLNPHDRRRTAGGSSAGSAAVV